MMKDLFILISGVLIAFNIGLISHKIGEYYKLKTSTTHETLKLEMIEFCIGKIQATFILTIFLIIILYTF